MTTIAKTSKVELGLLLSSLAILGGAAHWVIERGFMAETAAKAIERTDQKVSNVEESISKLNTNVEVIKTEVQNIKNMLQQERRK